MQKKIKLTDIILTVICVVFVAEAAAPVAALGNSQFFWWLFMIVAFLLPYGLISSELGTTYQGDGGLYDWINQAYPGTRWGARASWWYWLNFPLWMASLAVMVPDLLSIAFGIEISIWVSLAIQLAFILIVTIIACYPVCDSVIILNVCAVIKVGLALLVGGMGIYFIIQNGFVNDMSLKTFLPSFDLNSLSYISVIIFNMLGFEVICTFSDDMKDPKKEIPRAIVIGGLVIAAVYLFGGFGIGAGIPTEEIDEASGLIESVVVMSGQEGGLFIGAVALLFMVTLFGNMISWSLGVNNTACYAAENGDMPAPFTKRWAKNDMPIGSAVINGIVGAVICVVGVFMSLAGLDNLFWTFFLLNLVLFLMSYLPIFPAFLKLRKTDPDRERPFKVPGGKLMLKVMAFVPMILIVISVLFCIIPMPQIFQADAPAIAEIANTLEAELEEVNSTIMVFDSGTVANTLPITIGAVICIALGEVLIIIREKKNKK